MLQRERFSNGGDSDNGDDDVDDVNDDVNDDDDVADDVDGSSSNIYFEIKKQVKAMLPAGNACTQIKAND